MVYGLNDIDRSMLYDLSRDARRNSVTDIVDHVRVSAQTVRNRIKQLEESGVTKGYHPQIDYEPVHVYQVGERPSEKRSRSPGWSTSARL